MRTCKHKMGLLSLRRCGNEAVTQCVVCNLPICQEHMQSTDRGAYCLECYVESNPDRADSEGRLGRIFHRRSSYHSLGYHPHHWHARHHYDDFDRSRQSDEDGVVGDEMIDSDDFQDS